MKKTRVVNELISYDEFVKDQPKTLETAAAYHAYKGKKGKALFFNNAKPK